MESGGSNMTCTLIVDTENPGWLSSMVKVLKKLEGVTHFSFDAMHGIATISGKMDSQRILKVLNKVGGEHLLLHQVHYAFSVSSIQTMLGDMTILGDMTCLLLLHDSGFAAFTKILKTIQDVVYTITPIYSNTEESQKWTARVSGKCALLQFLVMLKKLQPHPQIVTIDYTYLIDLIKNNIETPVCKVTALPPPSSEAAATATKPEPPTTTTKPNKPCCLM